MRTTASDWVADQELLNYAAQQETAGLFESTHCCSILGMQSYKYELALFLIQELPSLSVSKMATYEPKQANIKRK